MVFCNYSMAQVDTVFCQNRLLWMVQMDVLVMLFNPHLSRISSLSNVHFPTLAGYRENVFSLSQAWKPPICDMEK
jgi:hypothetical protein